MEKIRIDFRIGKKNIIKSDPLILKEVFEIVKALKSDLSNLKNHESRNNRHYSTSCSR
jgi:hypothetical protein